MDLYEELLAKARETAQQLQGADKRTTTDTADDGTTVTGWVFHHFQSYNSEKNLGGGFWRETWGSSHIILSVEGIFYTFSLDGEEDTSGKRELRQKIQQTGKQELLNLGSGKPFAKATELLERFPYTLE